MLLHHVMIFSVVQAAFLCTQSSPTRARRRPSRRTAPGPTGRAGGPRAPCSSQHLGSATRPTPTHRQARFPALACPVPDRLHACSLVSGAQAASCIAGLVLLQERSPTTTTQPSLAAPPSPADMRCRTSPHDTQLRRPEVLQMHAISVQFFAAQASWHTAAFLPVRDAPHPLQLGSDRYHLSEILCCSGCLAHCSVPFYS